MYKVGKALKIFVNSASGIEKCFNAYTGNVVLPFPLGATSVTMNVLVPRLLVSVGAVKFERSASVFVRVTSRVTLFFVFTM